MNYHGEVLDEGSDFIAIECDGQIVVLKISLGAVSYSAVIDVCMSGSQAREVARHLIAATAALEGS